MKLKMFAVFDDALGAFARPIFCASRGIAVRSFADEAKRKDSEIAQHVKDFSLWYLGTYEDEVALFDTVKPERVALASDFAES